MPAFTDYKVADIALADSHHPIRTPMISATRTMPISTITPTLFPGFGTPSAAAPKPFPPRIEIDRPVHGSCANQLHLDAHSGSPELVRNPANILIRWTIGHPTVIDAPRPPLCNLAVVGL